MDRGLSLVFKQSIQSRRSIFSHRVYIRIHIPRLCIGIDLGQEACSIGICCHSSDSLNPRRAWRVVAVLIIVNPRLMIRDAALICTLAVSIVLILTLNVVRIPLIAPIASFIPFLIMISGVRGSSFASFKFTAMYTLLSGLIMLSTYLTERTKLKTESVNSSSVEV